VVAWVEDHPKTAIAGLLGLLGLLYFYAVPLRGLAHARESFARWRIERFGGVHQVDRSVQIYDVLLSFEPRPLDRLDVVSLFSNHVGGRSFEQELEAVVGAGGHVRVVTLDPRMGDESHPRHAAFAALGRAFGQEPWLFEANVWHSTATLVALQERLGERFEIRFTTDGLPDARAPFFTHGRSAHSYSSSKPKRRLDVIVPRPESPDGADSLAHPAMVIRNRPDHPEVKKYTAALEALWGASAPLDDALKSQLVARFDG